MRKRALRRITCVFGPRHTANYSAMPKRPASFDRDDMIIRDLERKLKLKKKKKLPRSFYDEGLGDILELVDNLGAAKPSYTDNKKKKQGSFKEVDDFDEDESNQDASQSEDNELEDISQASEAESSVSGGEDSDHDDEEDESLMSRLKEMRKKAPMNKPKKKQKDLYGFETGTVDKEATSKLLEPASVSENKDLIRQIRGQLNRLTVQSLPSISTLIEGLYARNSSFQINETICKVISDLIVIEYNLSPLSLVSEMSLLLATLHENVGDEVGGHAINHFFNLFESLIKTKASDECKKLDNVVALICYMYAVGLVEVSLFLELTGRLINLFDAKCIELLMFTLTAVGFIIRKESPGLMKQLILDIQNKANSVSAETFGKRIEFMLETLTEIKNNNILKVTSKSNGIVDPILRDDLRNVLKSCLKRSTKVTPLRGTYSQVLASNRWWVKVGSLIENANNAQETDEDKEKFDLADQFTLESEREEKVCKSLRLNSTPLRRSLFKAIITSSDYVEASDRLVAMCRKTQAAEAANVLIQIAIHEKTLNMFYVLTLRRLSNFDRRYKFAIFCALKDRLKDPSALSPMKRSNLCHLILQLLKCRVISLAVLKVFDFASITENESKMLVMKEILSLVTQEPEDSMKQILDSIPAKDHQLVASVKYFMSCFLDGKAECSKTRQLLLAKMKLVQRMKKRQSL